MEKKTGRLNSKQWIAFILTSIIPIWLIVLGVKNVIANKVLSSLTVISLWILPILFVISISFVILKEMKFIKKFLLWFILVIIYIVLFYLSIFLTTNGKKAAYYDEQAQKYYNDTLIDYLIFSLTPDWGDYRSIEIYDISYRIIIGETSTHVMICQYSADEYETVKASFEESLILENDMIFLGDDEQRQSLPETYIDDYYFRLLECDYEVYRHGVYPQSLAFWVTNDATCEIGILTSYDTELDYIDNMVKHIWNECGWKYVR